MTGTIIPTPPFDFAQSLGFLGEFKPMRGEHTLALNALTKAVRVDELSIVFQVCATGTVVAPQLDYALYADQPISAATHAAAEDRIAFFLSAADDLRPFYAAGADDAVFAPIIEHLYGYHQVKFLTPIECACWAVLTQRNQMTIARNMKQAILHHVGGEVEVAGVRYTPFPDAAHLADVGSETLTALIHHAQKAQYLHAVAEAFAGADETWLRNGPADDVAAWLRSVKGIGAWSASFILLRGLGRFERLPTNEEAIARAAANAYNSGVPLSASEIARIAARYGAFQGYWAHYLRVGGA